MANEKYRIITSTPGRVYVIPIIFDKLLLYLLLFTARERRRMGHFGTKSMETLVGTPLE